MTPSKAARLPSPARFQADLEDMPDLVEMREELSGLVISAAREAEEYQDSFERYSYLWTDDPREFMRNFLIYGRAVTPDDLDTRPEEALPKTPPSLTQFQQQVRVSLAPRNPPPPRGRGGHWAQLKPGVNPGGGGTSRPSGPRRKPWGRSGVRGTEGKA